MDTNQLVEQAALRLRQAAQDHVPCAPIRDIIGETDVRLAYQVQAYNTDHLLRKGRKIEGVKIGLTSVSPMMSLIGAHGTWS
ncbi:MAG: hypothetical protein AAFY91_17975 [Bacteroidota bacterium]